MDNKPSNSSSIPADIQALSRAYKLGKVHYLDISGQEYYEYILQRWPLLDELTQITSKKD